jgi:hypothetical protein
MTEEKQNTFHAWIQQKIQTALNHKQNHIPFVIWCDPHRTWKELLEASLVGTDIELWAIDIHELALRYKFYSEPKRPRVIWIPVSQQDLGYFKVFALQSDLVIEMPISEALDDFGVDIPVDQILSVEPLLPAHARQWIDYPLSYWKEKFSLGEAKVSLVDDETLLAVLASPGHAISEWLPSDRLPILNRRAGDDFGLPRLYDGSVASELPIHEVDQWRIRCVAALLVTEADEVLPTNPPGDRDRVIHGPAIRDRAIKLLYRWQKQFDFVEAFEELATKADAITSLQFWAKNLLELPPPLSSPVVENIRFQIELENLAKLETFEQVKDYLGMRLQSYRNHAESFWGKRAKNQVKWSFLVDLAESSMLLKQYAMVEKNWITPQDAANWYVQAGWRVDCIGEQLFKENNQLPGALVGVRAKLRQAYLRHLDRINTAFDDLVMHQAKKGSIPFPYDFAGKLLEKSIQANPKQPTAVIMVDACRYDVGCRLAEAINKTEPVQRAEVVPACSPLPTITPLGMTFALPGISEQIKVNLLDSAVQPWLITTDHFPGNLAEAASRREWLQQNLKVKEHAFLSIDQVLNSDSPDAISIKALGRLLFVFGDELDDHEGVLKPFGLDAVIDRYASLIRRLQVAGYSTIYLVTDHGFFHWEPASDEKDVAKPEGEILWKSRRAVVGKELKHHTALTMKVSGSELDVCVPRSINSFKTYGGLGFFHGGLTLQEWIIPVVTIRFPQKAQKLGGVLKPISQIISLAQRVQVGSHATQLDLLSGQAHENYLSRPVMIKVIHPATGKVILKSKQQVILEPGGDLVTLELMVVPGATAALKSELELRLLDADDEELLDHTKVTLQIELDEWA